MAVYQSQAVAFAQYATAQVAYHEQALALHELDGTGCCRFCGRAWPCDEARHSRRMVDHFSQWALIDEPAPTSGLVRTYLKGCRP
ncbi:hypothetical protein [Planosporangium mesophilum]|uniref:Uncharacterized protein n=1 Tax=Planosporangium mesophilum TaxID=689768 RepID=A0A8J3X4B4_9ACTN|nr:hypothetical protein [Planosporangium mesophilum]NJC84878.1 hypothetical protein [Planosporangium mesophilum]GII23658.1 hypothetical protein Pme01_32550 [Planosporangium mesophilum]